MIPEGKETSPERHHGKGVAGWTGLEPAASGVTGRRSNQLNYHPSREGERPWRRRGPAEVVVRRGVRAPDDQQSRRSIPSPEDSAARPGIFLHLSRAVPTADGGVVGGTGLEPVTAGV